MPGEPRFEVVAPEAVDVHGCGLDLGLGGWQAVAPPPSQVSFDADGASGGFSPADEAPLLFRVSVPTVDGKAAAALAAEGTRLAALHGRLDGASMQVDHALHA